MDKKLILSGIQPSGVMTIGNYIGAVKNWLPMQDEFNCLFMIADLHSITVRQNPQELRKRCLEFISLYLACGLDPEKCSLFFQSHVHEHAELGWILNCITYMGELSRMTQFKDKTKNAKDANIGSGLFTYPVLMASDILLYNADMVPVGVDQKQHLELTRNIAERFNQAFGETFKVPEPYIAKVGAKIMSLQSPEKKMSKSDENVNGYISVVDDADTVARKIRRAVTDSEGSVRRGEGKAGVENFMSIYSAFTGKDFDEIEKEFEGKGYGVFKDAVTEVLNDRLTPVRENYHRYLNDKEYLTKVYKEGAENASRIAYKTLKKVYRKVGFVNKEW